MSETVRRAVRTLGADPAAVFALLSDPSRHAETDASGMVRGPVGDARISGTGDVFTIEMAYDWGDGRVDHYRTDNHVDVFEPDEAIGWRVAGEGQEPFGWAWRYRLRAVPDGTEVELVYDWTDVPQEHVEAFGVPNFEVVDLEASLAELARATER